MTDGHLEARAKVLARLPMVEWDRCVRPGDGNLIVYGWIAREDGRRDFVCLEFLWSDEPCACTYTTSSARYSALISETLHGPGGHVECERVADVPGLAEALR